MGHRRFDVVIAGGAAVGSSTAYFLTSDPAFHEGGYLLLATHDGMPTLRENQILQRSLGADVALLDQTQLAAHYPWLQVDDLAGGALDLSRLGWLRILDNHPIVEKNVV